MVNFEPDRYEITDATVAAQCVLTTSADHGYSAGWYVRVQIPKDYGMRVDYVQTKVLSVPASDKLEVDVDTRAQAAFVAPSTTPSQVAQVMPISGQTLNVGT